jgi:GDP-L-fucose synthase
MRRVIERQDPIEVWGDGNDIKDFLYIEDLVEGLILAMEKTDQFDIINIVSGRSHTIREALSIILEIEGYDVDVVYDASKPTMIPKRLMDGSKAKKLLGFEAKTSLRDGLEKTIKWYKEERLNCF